MVHGDPVDARDHARPRAAAGAVEHADGDEVDALRDAVRGASDRAGDMGAVAVAVVGRAAVDGVEAAHGSSAELVVAEQDAGVDHVGGDARAGRVIAVGAREEQRSLIDPVETPGGAALGRRRHHVGIGLDVRNAGIAGETSRDPGGSVTAKPLSACS